MKITVTITTANAAFDDAPGRECARILREMAKYMDACNGPALKLVRESAYGWKTDAHFTDANGNGRDSEGNRIATLTIDDEGSKQ